MMVLLLLAVCCGAFAARSVVNSSLDETLDKEKIREAIRLWIFEMHMQSMLTLPTISEGEMNVGKQLLDPVCIGQPEFQSGLIYNSTVDKTVRMLDNFRVQQLIDNEYYDIAKANLEESDTFSKNTAGLKGQYMITGNIYLVDTTVDVQDPRSISWSFTFCKVAVDMIAFKKLTNNELNGKRNVFMILSALNYTAYRIFIDMLGGCGVTIKQQF